MSIQSRLNKIEKRLGTNDNLTEVFIWIKERRDEAPLLYYVVRTFEAFSETFHKKDNLEDKNEM